MLALLPVERVDSTPVEPGVQRGPQLGLAPEPVGERDLVDVDVEAVAELPQRPQLVELAQAVLAVAGTRFAAARRARRTRGTAASSATSPSASAASPTRIGRTLPQVCQGSMRPYLSSSRTTSSSCGVETSMIVVSSSAFTRWIVPGLIRNAAARADDLRVRRSCRPGSPISSCARPAWMSQDSSFSRWNWRLSDSPALTKRIFPQ